MRYRLLIVDDDPLNLDALTRVLRHDYDLVRAESADDPHAAAHDHHRVGPPRAAHGQAEMPGIEELRKAA